MDTNNMIENMFRQIYAGDAERQEMLDKLFPVHVSAETVESALHMQNTETVRAMGTQFYSSGNGAAIPVRHGEAQ